MNLPIPFSLKNAPVWKRILEQEDTNNLKRGRDIEVGGARVILTAPNGTRYALQVSNTGTVSAVAV
ncbi:MAG TPA: hypothetical protein VG818_08925 [Gemmatimonadaceae bacterium]|nr:hypothetical protein [Gemmatimonadaceae bacterium]